MAQFGHRPEHGTNPYLFVMGHRMGKVLGLVPCLGRWRMGKALGLAPCHGRIYGAREGEDGKVRLSYNDLLALATRQNIRSLPLKIIMRQINHTFEPSVIDQTN